MPELPDVEIFRGRVEDALRRPITSISLDAGLGNVYVDEILFQAGVHPGRSVSELDDDALEEVRRAMKAVLARAIEADADPAEMPRTWLLPNREEGAECPRCEGTIVKSQVAGRSTYRCDAHQPASG